MIEQIGKGNFGLVFKAINIGKNNELVAVKIEDRLANKKVLNNEAKILKHLSDLDCVQIEVVWSFIIIDILF